MCRLKFQKNEGWNYLNCDIRTSQWCWDCNWDFCSSKSGIINGLDRFYPSFKDGLFGLLILCAVAPLAIFVIELINWDEWDEDSNFDVGCSFHNYIEAFSWFLLPIVPI
jgi:hypothetical protein